MRQLRVRVCSELWCGDWKSEGTSRELCGKVLYLAKHVWAQQRKR